MRMIEDHEFWWGKWSLPWEEWWSTTGFLGHLPILKQTQPSQCHHDFWMSWYPYSACHDHSTWRRWLVISLDWKILKFNLRTLITNISNKNRANQKHHGDSTCENEWFTLCHLWMSDVMGSWPHSWANSFDSHIWKLFRVKVCILVIKVSNKQWINE